MLKLSDWLPNSPLKGPPVPRWMQSSWAEFLAVRRREFADLKNEIGGPPILPDLFYLTVNSIGSAAVDTLKPGTLQKWVDTLNEQIVAEGQFTQFSVFYRDISIPPLVWDYKCRKCLWWGPANGMPDRSCKAVAGDITPQGWCVIWLPPPAYKPMTWPRELLEGDW